ncbi:MAG: hypothetical protein ACREN6_17460 [Gemmatimonadaceae bacterium]
MFDRSRLACRATVGAWMAFTLAASVPLAVRAQDSPRLRTRLVAALRDRKTMIDSSDALRANRARDLPPDSLSSGVVHVRFSKQNLGTDLQASLAAAVARAGAIADVQFGDAKLDGPGSVILVERVEAPSWTALTLNVLRVELPGANGRIAIVRSPLTESKLSDELLDMLGSLATQGVPVNVTKWVGYWAPSRPLTSDDWLGASLDLMTSNSSVTRTCFTGSEAACEIALGLTPVSDPLVDWYTPEGWRALVSTWDSPANDAALAAAHAECVTRKVFETCKRLARTRNVPVPLNMMTRSTLFNLAIARGGRSAYTRLRSATGTPREVLASIAGVPIEALVDDWRTHAIAAAPHSVLPSGRETTALIAWTALFGFAATRRRVWR